ncbi:MAG: hypothetical protein ACREDV_12065 [Methylocella sp.]
MIPESFVRLVTSFANRASDIDRFLDKLPKDLIERLKALLKGGTVIGTGTGEIAIERPAPHGHVAAPNVHASARNFRPQPNAR